MKQFWLNIKNWFARAWLWIKTRFSRTNPDGYPVVSRVSPRLKYAGSLLIIGLALLGTILYVRSKDDDNSDGQRSVEIAQVYEPSIGTALAPDTPSSGSVSGEVATSQAPSQAGQPATAPTSGVNLNGPYVAPNTGVDPSSPVEYSNSTYEFAAMLPVGASVVEQDGEVTFLSGKNNRYYTVSVSPQGNETLASVEAQLKNSSSIKSLQTTSFNGMAALQFTSTDNTGAGTVFIKNNQVYYLLGNSEYFSSFQTI